MVNWVVVGSAGVGIFLGTIMIGGGIIYNIYTKNKKEGRRPSLSESQPMNKPEIFKPKKIKGANLDKLEEDVFKEFQMAYNDIMDEINRAEEKEEGLDLKSFVRSQASRFQNLNNHFRDAKIRIGIK